MLCYRNARVLHTAGCLHQRIKNTGFVDDRTGQRREQRCAMMEEGRTGVTHDRWTGDPRRNESGSEIRQQNENMYR